MEWVLVKCFGLTRDALALKKHLHKHVVVHQVVRGQTTERADPVAIVHGIYVVHAVAIYEGRLDPGSFPESNSASWRNHLHCVDEAGELLRAPFAKACRWDQVWLWRFAILSPPIGCIPQGAIHNNGIRSFSKCCKDL